MRELSWDGMLILKLCLACKSMSHCTWLYSGEWCKACQAVFCYNTLQQGGNESKNGRPWYAQSKLCPAICKRSRSATKIGNTSNQLLTTSSGSEVKLGASSATGGRWHVINLFWLINREAPVIWKTMEICCLRRSLKVIVIEEETFQSFGIPSSIHKAWNKIIGLFEQSIEIFIANERNLHMIFAHVTLEATKLWVESE